MSLTGSPDGEPYRAGISVFDVMAGLHATIGILAALQRPRTRPAAASTSRSTCCPPRCPGWSTSPAPTSPAAWSRCGWATAIPSLFPYEPLPCADGELIITAGNNGQFRKLVEVLGVPELADDPRFARNEDRTANRDELRPLLVERLATRTDDGVVPRRSSRAGVPCGPINTVDGGVAFAEEIGLDPVVEVGEGDATVPSVRNPITFSETPADYRLPPPALDEHGDEIRALAGPADRRRVVAASARPHRTRSER